MQNVQHELNMVDIIMKSYTISTSYIFWSFQIHLMVFICKLMSDVIT